MNGELAPAIDKMHEIVDRAKSSSLRRGIDHAGARSEPDEGGRGGSVFVTMTDMTISFLLIVMILLAFFATQLSSKDTVPRQQYEATSPTFGMPGPISGDWRRNVTLP